MILLTVDEIIMLHEKLLAATGACRGCVTVVFWNPPYLA